MPNKIFPTQNPDGYGLKAKSDLEEKWRDVLRFGKTIDDVLNAIDSLPLSFRSKAELYYGEPSDKFAYTDYEKGIIKLRVESV